MDTLNITPDSFSNSGLYVNTDVVVERVHRTVHQGVDTVDVGDESTYPGATALSAREEWNRIGAVAAALGKTDAVVSIDTYHADVARRAIDAGVEIANDVIGGTGGLNMFSAVASSNCLYVLQHDRGSARTMDFLANYGDIRAEVTDELIVPVARAISSRIDASQIVIDPGLGFTEVGDDDQDSTTDMVPIMGLDMPVLVRAFRKYFLVKIHNGHSDSAQRGDAVAAPTAYFVELGMWGVRVHEVAVSRAAVGTVVRLCTVGAYP